MSAAVQSCSITSTKSSRALVADASGSGVGSNVEVGLGHSDSMRGGSSLSDNDCRSRSWTFLD